MSYDIVSDSDMENDSNTGNDSNKRIYEEGENKEDNQLSKKRKTQDNVLNVLEQLLKAIKENIMIDTNVIDNIQIIIESFKKQENISDILLSDLINFVEKVKEEITINSEKIQSDTFIKNIHQYFIKYKDNIRNEISGTLTPIIQKSISQTPLSPLYQAKNLVKKKLSQSPSKSPTRSTSLNEEQQQITVNKVDLVGDIVEVEDNKFSDYDIILLKFLNIFKDENIKEFTELSEDQIEKIEKIISKIYDGKESLTISFIDLPNNVNVLNSDIEEFASKLYNFDPILESINENRQGHINKNIDTYNSKVAEIINKYDNKLKVYNKCEENKKTAFNTLDTEKSKEINNSKDKTLTLDRISYYQNEEFKITKQYKCDDKEKIEKNRSKELKKAFDDLQKEKNDNVLKEYTKGNIKTLTEIYKDLIKVFGYLLKEKEPKVNQLCTLKIETIEEKEEGTIKCKSEDKGFKKIAKTYGTLVDKFYFDYDYVPGDAYELWQLYGINNPIIVELFYFVSKYPKLALPIFLWIDTFHDFKNQRVDENYVDGKKANNKISEICTQKKIKTLYTENGEKKSTIKNGKTDSFEFQDFVTGAKISEKSVYNLDWLYQSMFFEFSKYNKNLPTNVSFVDDVKDTVLATCKEWDDNNTEDFPDNYCANLLYRISQLLIVNSKDWESQLFHSYLLYNFFRKNDYYTKGNNTKGGIFFGDEDNKEEKKKNFLKALCALTFVQEISEKSIKYYAKDVDKGSENILEGKLVILPASIFDANPSNSSKDSNDIVCIEKTILPYLTSTDVIYEYNKKYKDNNKTYDTIGKLKITCDDNLNTKDKNLCFGIKNNFTTTDNKTVKIENPANNSVSSIIYEIVDRLNNPNKADGSDINEVIPLKIFDRLLARKRAGDYAQIIQCKQLGIPLFTTDNMQKLISVAACSSVVWNADGTRFMWYDGSNDCLKVNNYQYLTEEERNINKERNINGDFKRIQTIYKNENETMNENENENEYKKAIDALFIDNNIFNNKVNNLLTNSRRAREKNIFDYHPMYLANPYIINNVYPYYKKENLSSENLTFKDILEEKDEKGNIISKTKIGIGSAPFQKIKYKQSRGRKIKRYNTATKISKKVNTPVKSKKLKQKKYKQTRGRKIKRFRNKSV